MENNLAGVEARHRGSVREVFRKASETFLLKAELNAVGLVHGDQHNSKTACEKLASRTDRSISLNATNDNYVHMSCSLSLTT